MPYLQESLRIQQQLPHDDDSSIGLIVAEVAIALLDQGRIDESDGYFSEAFADLSPNQDQWLGSPCEAHRSTWGVLRKCARIPKQALEHLEHALRLMRRLKGPSDPEVGAILAEMSNIKVWSDDLAGAERAAREAVAIYQVDARDCILTA